jgi:hypothetical protein
MVELRGNVAVITGGGGGLGPVRTVRAFLALLQATDGWRRIVPTASSNVLALDRMEAS